MQWPPVSAGWHGYPKRKSREDTPVGTEATEHRLDTLATTAKAVPEDQRRRAAQVVVRYAHHAAEREKLLAMLGLSPPPADR